MHCVLWAYSVPPALTKAAIELAGVSERWGATPTKTEWVVPIVAESTEGRVVRA